MRLWPGPQIGWKCEGLYSRHWISRASQCRRRHRAVLSAGSTYLPDLRDDTVRSCCSSTERISTGRSARLCCPTHRGERLQRTKGWRRNQSRIWERNGRPGRYPRQLRPESRTSHWRRWCSSRSPHFHCPALNSHRSFRSPCLPTESTPLPPNNHKSPDASI
jgi:hypothetical protein